MNEYQRRLGLLRTYGNDFKQKYGDDSFKKYSNYYQTKSVIADAGIDQEVIAPTYKNIDYLFDNKNELVNQYGINGYNQLYKQAYEQAKPDIKRIESAVKIKKDAFSADAFNLSPTLRDSFVYTDDEEDSIRKSLGLAPKDFNQTLAKKLVKQANEARGIETSDIGNKPVTEEELKQAINIVYGLNKSDLNTNFEQRETFRQANRIEKDYNAPIEFLDRNKEEIIQGVQDSEQREQKQEYYSQSDTGVARKNLEAIDQGIAQLEEKINTLANDPYAQVQLEENPNITYPDGFTDRQKQLYAWGEQLKNAKAQRANQQGNVANSETVQKLEPHYAQMQNPDFNAKSAQGASANDDWIHSYINDSPYNNTTARNYIRATHGENGNQPEYKYDQLTPEETAIYNYYYSQSKEQADKFLKDIDDTLLQRQGQENADLVKQDFGAVGQVLQGVGGGLDRGITSVKQIFNKDALPTTAIEYQSSAIRQDLGDIGGTIYDVISNAANMLPSIAVGTINPVAGAVSLGLTSSADAYRGAVQQGYSRDQALKYGVLSGVKETLMTYALSGISQLGGAVTGRTITALTKGIKSNFAKGAVIFLTKMVSEAGEEFTQEFLDPILRNFSLDENNKVEFANSDQLYAGLLGALTAGLFETGSIKADLKKSIVSDIEQQTGLKAEDLSPQTQAPSEIPSTRPNLTIEPSIPQESTNTLPQQKTQEKSKIPSITKQYSKLEVETDNENELVIDVVAPKKKIKQSAQSDKIADVLVNNKQLKEPVRKVFSDIKEFAQRKFSDSGIALDKVGKKAKDDVFYPLFNNAKQGRQAAQAMLGMYQFDLNGNKTGDSLIDIMSPIDEKGYAYKKDFFTYLHHKHNSYRMLANKPVFGESITSEISDTESNNLLAKYPEFEQYAEKIYNYNKNLQKWRVQAGRITQEQADNLLEVYPYYVPTFRKIPGTSSSRATGSTVEIGSTLFKAKGSNLDLMPIDDSMARQTIQVIEEAKKNILANRLLNIALENEQAVSGRVQSVEVEEDTDDIDADTLESKQKENEDLTNTIVFYRDGKRIKMRVDNATFEAFKSISTTGAEYSKFIAGAKEVNKIFKELITGYNPYFLVRNAIRDPQDVVMYSKDLKVFAKNFPRAYKEMMTKGGGEYWNLYQAFGGTGSSFFDYEQGLNPKESKIKKYTLGRIELLNKVIEQAPRLAEFISTIEKGGKSYENIMKALYNSAEVTVNFGRSGSWGKAINSTFVPFFNPSVQGASRFIRRFTETKGVKDWTSLVIRAAVMGIAPVILNNIIFGDDDEWEMINGRDKDRYYLFKIGDKVWAKIPRGRVLSLFSGITRRVGDALEGKDVDLAGFLDLASEQVAPVSILESNILTPVTNAMANKTWYGSEIDTKRLMNYKPGERFDESTDAFSKWLGGLLNVSPKRINYVLDAYTGVVGDTVLPLMSPRAEQNPFVKSFTLDTALSNNASEKFYSKADEILYKNNSKVTKTEETIKLNTYVNKVKSSINDIGEKIREIENGEESDAQKQAKVRVLRMAVTELQLAAIKAIEDYEKDKISKLPSVPKGK